MKPPALILPRPVDIILLGDFLWPSFDTQRRPANIFRLVALCFSRRLGCPRCRTPGKNWPNLGPASEIPRRRSPPPYSPLQAIDCSAFFANSCPTRSKSYGLNPRMEGIDSKASRRRRGLVPTRQADCFTVSHAESISDFELRQPRSGAIRHNLRHQ